MKVLDGATIGIKLTVQSTHIAQNIEERCQEYFQYFIATLQFQLSEIFLKTNKYLILLEIFQKDSLEMCLSYALE